MIAGVDQWAWLRPLISDINRRLVGHGKAPIRAGDTIAFVRERINFLHKLVGVMPIADGDTLIECERRITTMLKAWP